MSATPLEKRRIQVSTGSLNSKKLEQLAATHPFTQQETLDVALAGLETHYHKGKVRITDILNRVDGPSGFNNVLMLALPDLSGSPDVWCIDLRGVLTLSVCKETYETIGLPGKSLPFKGHTDQHVIQISLKKIPLLTTLQAKQKTLLYAWEERRRTQNGLDGWEVVYCSQDPDVDLGFAGTWQRRRATCTYQESNSVHIPIPTISPRPNARQGKSGKSDATVGELEDWTEGVMNLYEWVGLATLGAQRLQANDSVNPFIAVYEPPQPSQIGDMTHLCWKGLLSPSFVQTVIDATRSSPNNDLNSSASFVSITFHGIPASPVAYLPPQSHEAKVSDDPVRLPRAGGEDTSSLLIGRDSYGTPSWTLLESVGQWDTRWG